MGGWHQLVTAIGELVEHLYDGGGVDTADLARVSNTNPRSVARWRTQQTAPRREAEERLLELRAVVDLAGKVIRGDAVRLWLRSPDPDLAPRQPLTAVRFGHHRCGALLKHFQAIARQQAARSIENTFGGLEGLLGVAGVDAR